MLDDKKKKKAAPKPSDDIDREMRSLGLLRPEKPQAGGADGDESVARVLDDEFSRLGYSPTARLSILGDVGRENSWNRNIIFGGHADPANNEKNRGIISWQKDRRLKLDSYLKSAGVHGRGDDDELRGMARFMDEELKTSYKGEYEALRNAPTTAHASKALQRYIRYSMDPKYNTPDRDFHSTHNRNWALKAKKLGLAGDGPSTKGGFDFDAFAADLMGDKKPGGPSSTRSEVTEAGPDTLAPGVPFYGEQESSPAGKAAVSDLSKMTREQLDVLREKNGLPSPGAKGYKYQFEIDGNVGGDLKYTGSFNDRYFAKDKDGNDWEFDTLARSWKSEKPLPMKLKLSDGTELTEESGSEVKPGETGTKRLRDARGRIFLATESERTKDENGNESVSWAVTPEQSAKPAPGVKGRSGVIRRETTGVTVADEAKSYEFEKSGRLKLADGTELGLVNDQPAPEGKNRFRDADGETYLFDRETGKMEDESLSQVGAIVPVMRANVTDSLPVAKQARTRQVAMSLAPQFGIDAADAEAWITARGFTDAETGAVLPDDRYFRDRSQIGQMPGKEAPDDFHRMTRRDIRDLVNFGKAEKKKREDRVLTMIEQGEQPSPELLKKLRIDPNFQSDRYDDIQMAATKGQVAKSQLEALIPRFKAQGSDGYQAKIQAKRAMGFITPKDEQAELQAYAELQGEQIERFKALQGVQTPQVTTGKAAMIQFPEVPYEQKAAEATERMLAKYGDAQGYQAAKQKEAQDEAARLQRIEDMGLVDRWTDRVRGAPRRVVKGALKTLVSESLRGSVVYSKWLANQLEDLTGLAPEIKNVEDHPMYKAGNTVDKWLDWALRTNKDIDQELLAGKLPTTVGTSLAMMLPSLGKNPKAAIALYSTLQMGGAGFNEARKAGASEEDALTFALANSLLFGWTETVGISNALIRLKQLGGGAYGQFIQQLAKTAPNEIAEEILLNEGPQTLGSNILAKVIYDPDRDVLDGLGEALLLAGLSAGSVSSLVTAANTVQNSRAIRAQLQNDSKHGGPAFRNFGESGTYVHGQRFQPTPEMEPLLAKHKANIEDISFAQEAIRRIRDKAAGIEDVNERLNLFRTVRDLQDTVQELYVEQAQVASQIVDASGVPKPSPIELKDQWEDAAAADTQTVENEQIPGGMSTDSETVDGFDTTLADGRRVKVIDDRGKLLLVEDDRGRQTLQPERKFTDLEDFRSKANQQSPKPQDDAGFVHERPVTLEAQTESMADPKNASAIAVLFTDPESAVVPEGATRFLLPDGALLVNNEKFKSKYGVHPVRKKAEIESGLIPHEELIGGKAVPDRDTTQGTALVTTDADGNELNSSKISNNPVEEWNGEDFAAAVEQANLDQKRFGEQAANIGAADTAEIIASREEDRPIETAPLDGVRRNRAVIEPPKSAAMAPKRAVSKNALERFEERKLTRLGYDAEQQAGLSAEQRSKILTDRIPRREFFRKSEKAIRPVTLAKPLIVEISRNVRGRLRKKNTARRLQKLGYSFSVGSKTVRITGIPPGKSDGEVAGSFETLVYNTDEERRAKIGQGNVRNLRSTKKASLSQFVRANGGISEDADLKRKKRKSGELDRFKGFAGILNQNSPHNAESMAHLAQEAGYFGRDEDGHIGGGQLNVDTFLEALDGDLGGSKVFAVFGGTHSDAGNDVIEDQVANMEREKHAADILASLTDEEARIAEAIARILNQDGIWPLIEESEFSGEMSDAARAKFVEIGVNYDLTKDDAETALETILRIFRQWNGTAEENAESGSETFGEGDRVGRPGSQGDQLAEGSVYREDSFDPEDEEERLAIAAEDADELSDDDLSFDFSEEDEAGADSSVSDEAATDAAHEAATSPKNDLAEPTEGQIEAGNYKKGHISVNGIRISIENPAGSERKGVDGDGKPWSVTMRDHYGYIKGSVGADTEHIDVFVKDGTPADFSGEVFVVDQVDPESGKFDEHKVMVGYADEAEARQAYLANYTDDWKGLKAITAMPLAQFKAWAADGVRSEPVTDLTKKAEVVREPVRTSETNALPSNKKFEQKPASEAKNETNPDLQSNKPDDSISHLDTPEKLEANRQEYIKAYRDDPYGFGVSGKIADPPDIDESPEIFPAKPLPVLDEAKADDSRSELSKEPEQSGFGFTDDGGLFSEGGPKAIEEAANFENEDGRKKRLADLAAKNAEQIKKETIAAYGETTGEYLGALSGSKGTIGPIAETLIKLRNLVLDKGDAAKQLVEDAADALDLFMLGNEQNRDIDEVLKQPRLDGKAFTDTAKDYARSMEAGTFGDVFRADLNAIVTPADEAAEADTAIAESITAPINDFGEKIGGARKDTSESGYVMIGGKKSEQPAWMKGFQIGETAEGKYRPFKSTDRGMIQWQSREEFATKEEALQAIKLANVAQKFRTRKGENGYEIYRRVTDRKFHTIKDGFETEKDAMLHMVENVDKFLAYKPQFPERPHIEDLRRTGKDFRSGKNVTTEEFVKQFGFTGGEFGNWVPQDERQRILNMAYDGLMDLADILDLPPAALSLNGQLSIAFGSRGHGLTGAAAHYEADRAVFNLTRLNGAGAMAHEWFHALDHYFGAQDRRMTLEKDEKGLVKAISKNRSHFLTHGYSARGGVRPELLEAFKDLLKTIYKQPKIVEVSIDRYEGIVERNLSERDRIIDDLRRYIEIEYKYARKSKPASSDQLAQFDKLVEMIKGGNWGDMVDVPTKSRHSFGMQTFQVFKDLNDIIVAVRGRSEFKSLSERSDGGRVRKLASFSKTIRDSELQLENYRKDNREERLSPTKFSYDARDIDKMRSSDYWSTEHEMAARAFEAFIEDQLKESGDVSQYLVHSTENSAYKLLYGLNPYPEGVERERITEAFWKFFDVIETEETDQGVMLRSVASPVIGFYSQLERLIDEKMPAKASAEQIRGIVKTGVKQDELDWLDLDSFLAQKPTFSKQEVLDHVRANNADVREIFKTKPSIDAEFERLIDEGWSREEAEAMADAASKPGEQPTKYDQHVLPGGENYKELLLTLPPRDTVTRSSVKTAAGWGDSEGGDIGFVETGNTGADYRSGHWSEPNVLAHVRFDERDGGETLHIAEIQSDWHQAGRDRGYAQAERPFVVFDTHTGKEIDRFRTADEAKAKTSLDASLDFDNELNAVSPDNARVPDAPFKKSWHELALKRMFRYAVENGFERVTWDTGDTQADLNDLSKKIAKISWAKNQFGGGTRVEMYPIGFTENYSQLVRSDEELFRYVGKEIGRKILEGPETGTLNNPDLKFGGDGMRGFYDQIVPAFARKYLKKWGATVSSTESDGNTFHSVMITPAMRESVLAGQPLFKKRDAASAELLGTVLPKAHTQDIFEGIESSFEGEDLYVNEYASEQLRRMLGEQNFRRTGVENEEASFDGITLGAGQLMSLAGLGRDLRIDYARAGYSDESLEAFDRLLEDLEKLAAKAEDFGVVFTFDDVLPEEHFHQEDLRAGRTDMAAIEQLKSHPIWQEPGVKFLEEYPTLSDKDKASELAAKLATNQAGKYGWAALPDFESLRKEFLDTWYDGILRKNDAVIQSEGIDAFKQRFRRISNYATLAQTDRGRSGEAQGDRRSGRRSGGKGKGAGPSGKTSDAPSVPATAGSPGRRLRSAEEAESVEADELDAQALGVTLGEVRIKNRQFARTLRESGRDASDVPYVPESEVGWMNEAKAILQQSVDRADASNFVQHDYAYALEVFEDLATPASTRVVLGIALIDHLGAMGDYPMMLRVGEMVTSTLGTAAQTLRASQIVTKYDFARGVELVRRALEKRGRELSPEQIDEIREISRLYNKVVREKALVESNLRDAEELMAEQQAELDEKTNALADAEGRIGFSQSEVDELNRAIDEQTEELTEKEHLVENLKRQLGRWKNKVLGNSATSFRTAKTHKELLERKPLIRQKLAASFPGRPLKGVLVGDREERRDPKTQELYDGMRRRAEDLFRPIESRPYIGPEAEVRDPEPEKPLKAVTSATFDDETRLALVEYVALQIFEGESFETTIEMLEDLTQGILNSDEIYAIHADGEAKTHGSKVERSPEAIARMKNRSEHRRKARAFLEGDNSASSKRRAGGFDSIERKMLELAGNDHELGAAAVFLNKAKSAEAWATVMHRAYPEMDPKLLDDLYLKARNLRERSKTSVLRDSDNLRSDMSLTAEAFEAYRHKRRIVDSMERKHKASLDLLHRKAEKSQGVKIAENVLDALSIPKSLMSTGEASYIGRQGFLPLLLFTGVDVRNRKLTDGAIKGLRGTIAGFQSETNRLIYEETLRTHRNFGRAQMAGVTFSQIGDFNLPDEHFASRAFDMAANSKYKVLRGIGKGQQKFEHAYTLPGDAQRLFIASTLFDLIDDQQLEPYQVAAAEKAAARIANAFTGKTNLRLFRSDNLVTKFINAVGFSPSFVGSRFESAFHLSPIGIAAAPKGLRVMLAKKAIRFHSAMAALAIAAAMVLDPEGDDDERSRWDILDPSSKSFLRGRIRGLDQKFDLTANMSEPMRLFVYNAVGSAFFAARGDWNKLADIWKQERERYIYTDSGEPLRYFRGKLSPSASFVYDVASGTDYLGRETRSTAGDVAVAASQRLWPLTYQQTVESLISDQATELMKPTLWENKKQQWENIKNGDLNLPEAFAVFVTSALGANFQDFAETERSRAETKAWDMYSGFESKKQTPEEKAIGAGIRRIYRFRAEQVRRGKDTELLDRRLNEILAKYEIGPKDQKKLAEQATGSRFAFVTKQMSEEQVRTLIDEYATDRERPELERILEAIIEKRNKAPKPPKSLAEKLHGGDVAEAVKLYLENEPEFNARQKMEARRKIREKAMNSNSRRQMSRETYDAVKSLLGNFPPHRPQRKVVKKIRGLDSLKQVYE